MTEKTLIKSFSIVSSWTFASRILGFLRDIFLAFFLGSGAVAQAFLVAFTLPNMLRKIFAEGSFNKVFIPMFVDLKNNPREASNFASIIFIILLALLTIISALGVLFMPYLIKFLAFGFLTDNRFDLAVTYGQILFPYILLISLTQLFNSILNSLNLYHMSTATQCILNLALISSLFLSSFFEGNFGINLCVSVIIAGIINLILVFRSCRINGITLNFLNLDYSKSSLDRSKKFLTKFLPIGIASGVTQINLVVGRQISSLFDGAVVWLIYADRLAQLPVAIIGVALNIVTLPKLTEFKNRKELDKINFYLNRSLQLSFLFSLPACIGLILLNKEIVSAIFERGNFNLNDTKNTSIALAIYSLSIIPISFQMLFLNYYFAEKEIKIPFFYSIVSVIMNIILAYSFLNYFEYLSPAIAYSITNFMLTFFLVIQTIKRGFFFDEIFKKVSIYIIFSSMFMILILLMTKYFILDIMTLPYLKILKLIILIVLGSSAYFVCIYYFRVLKNENWKFDKKKP